MGSKITKGQVLKKVKRNLALFDAALLAAQAAPPTVQSAEDVDAQAAKLEDNRRALLTVAQTIGTLTDDGQELTTAKEALDLRLKQYAYFLIRMPKPQPSSKPPPKAPVLDPEEQGIADTHAFLAAAVADLSAQIQRAETTIEDALMSISAACSVVEESKQTAVFDNLLVLQEDRQWHVGRLERVQKLFAKEEVSVEQVLAVKDDIEKYIKYNESPGFKTDRSVYDPLALDAPRKPSSKPTYIHDVSDIEDDDDYGFAPYDEHIDIEEELRYAEAQAARASAAREEAGWEEVAVKKKREPRDRPAGEITSWEEHADEVPDDQKAPNFRTKTCREWLRNGTCSYGARCHYLHGYPPEKPENEAKNKAKASLHDHQKEQKNGEGNEEYFSPAKIAERAKTPCKWFHSPVGCNRPGAGSGPGACHFLHEERPEVKNELKKSSDWRTAMCIKMNRPDGCPYGPERCSFAHSPELLRRKEKTAVWGEDDAAPPAIFDLKEDEFPDLAQQPLSQPLKPAQAETSSTSKAKKLAAVVASSPASATTNNLHLGRTESVSAAGSVVSHDSRSSARLPPVAQQQPMSPELAPVAVSPSSATVPKPVTLPISAHKPVATPKASDEQISRNAYATARSARAEQPSEQRAVSPAPPLQATPSAPTVTLVAQPSAPISNTPFGPTVFPSPVKVLPSPSIISPPAFPAPAPAPAPRPVRIFPLGYGACLTHFFAGHCANAPCLNRHALSPAGEDFGLGLLDFLGPGACLNHFLAGHCITGIACQARHQLLEVDYVAHKFAPQPVGPPQNVQGPVQPSPLQPVPFQQQQQQQPMLKQHAPFQAAVQPPTAAAAATPPISQAPPAHAPPRAPAQPSTSDSYPAHLTRSVSDLVVSDDDDEDDKDTRESADAFVVSDEEGEVEIW